MLSLDQVKKLGLRFYEYKEGVYSYCIDDKETLIENGKTLIEDAYYVYWYEKGVFDYEKDGEFVEVGY